MVAGRIIGAMVVCLGALSACGGDDSGSSNGSTGGQGGSTGGTGAAGGAGGSGGSVGGQAGSTGATGGVAGTAGSGASGGTGGSGGASVQPTAIVALAAGKSHTCALFDTHDVRCWGLDSNGRLGYPNLGQQAIGDDETPKSWGKNVDIGGPVERIAAGDTHTCALMSNPKRLRCWGTSWDGRLGYGNGDAVGATKTVAAAGDVDTGTSDVVDFALGSKHTCAVLADGNLRCWGVCGESGASTGLCGYTDKLESIGDNETPASVAPVDVGAKVLKVAAGENHTCIIIEGGHVRCWGSGAWGRLGYASTADIKDKAPKDIPNVDIGAEEAVDIVAGQNNTCVRFKSNKVLCWGAGNLGVAANNGSHLGDNETPATKGSIDVGGNVTQISLDAVGNHVCALLDTKKVRCWGAGSNGKLGYGNTTTVHTPATAGDVSVGEDVTETIVGGAHSCAVTSKGQVRCWGSGAAGQLGYGNTTTIGDDELPSSVGDVPTF